MASRENEYRCSLSDSLIERAQHELREKAEWRLRDIQALRDLVLVHPGLVSRTDDHFLLKFLRARKFEYDHAYRLVVNYYKMRSSHSDIFTNFLPSAVRHIFEEGAVCLLPSRDQNGSRIIVIRPGLWFSEQQRYPFLDTTRAALMVLEKISEEEETQVNGLIVIIDLSRISLINLQQYIWSGFGKVTVSLLQNSFPMRLKAIHFLHGPSLLLNSLMLKPFLKEKISERIHSHGSDLTKFHCHVSRYLLPGDPEIGGTLQPLPYQAFIDWILATDGEFLENSRYYLHQEPKSTTTPSGGQNPHQSDPLECFMGSYRKLISD